MHAPPEIADFDLAVQAHEDILGFNIAVHDVLFVQVLERRGHLGNVLRGLPFGEFLGFAQVLVELAFAGEFEDKEDALAVVEVAVEAEDVGVGEVALDFDFAPDLLFHFALLEFGFVEDFQGADEARAAFSGQVDAAELAFAEGFADFEHAQVEFFGFWQWWLLGECERIGVRRTRLGARPLSGLRWQCDLGYGSIDGARMSDLASCCIGGQFLEWELESVLQGGGTEVGEGDGGIESTLNRGIVSIAVVQNDCIADNAPSSCAARPAHYCRSSRPER